MIEIHPYQLLAAAGIFLITLLCLNTILFRPFIRIVQQREKLTLGRLEESDRLLRRYQQLAQEYESRIREEQLQSYRHREERRNEALARRAVMVEEARRRAEQLTDDARMEISMQLEKVKVNLQSEARDLARAIGRVVLGREVR
ncbi:MAG: ATP synthase F0 subunit B [Acidobacteria bacterium]|nr:ATP synthase F0 subunit B [Acidobacteriota bacterium]